MKIQIRKNIFETNSSSTHAVCICTEEEYSAWENGTMVYDDWNNDLVLRSTVFIEPDLKYPRYLTVDEYETYYEKHVGGEKQKFYKEREMPDGTKLIAFGYCGHI